jgi:hypothetical protein
MARLHVTVPFLRNGPVEPIRDRCSSPEEPVTREFLHEILPGRFLLADHRDDLVEVGVSIAKN